MKRLISVLLLLIPGLNFGQTIFISVNVPGDYLIVVDENKVIQGRFDSKNIAKVKLGTLLEVKRYQDDHVTQFRFVNPKIRSNDTLKLEFQSFHSIDTTVYTSGCLDGSLSEKKVTTEEFNKGMIEKDAMMNEVVVRYGKKKLILRKMLLPIYESISGNGVRDGKDWGYKETTERILVIYQNF